VLSSLRERAKAVRVATVTMAHDGQTPHVGSALSAADILVALYFHALRGDPSRAPTRPEGARIILRHGPGCSSSSAPRPERAFFAAELLKGYAQNGQKLAEHPSPTGVPGVEVATGS